MQNKNTLLISLFGGPGCAKSIMAAEIFAKLKWQGRSAELAFEYAKTRVYENAINTLANQIYILGKQHHIVYRLLNQVEFIVTDSPFLLGCVYDSSNDTHLQSLIINEYKKFNAYNFFLIRDEKTFESRGRLQNLEESKIIDEKIIKLLVNNNIPFEYIKSCPENVSVIVNKVLKRVDNP